MIATSDLVAAKELKSRLVDLMAVDELRVFGSRARGDADPDSDLDVLVVLRENAKGLKNSVRDIAWEVGIKHGLVISTIVIDRYELYETPLRSSPFVMAVEEEGVAV
jgi:predicted nucleotidyltransferase